MKGKSALPAVVKESLANLHQLFPERALGLIHAFRSTNNEYKKFPQWREDQIAKLGLMVVETAMDLERAYFEKRITTLGWAARNLLELSIWIDYCNLSGGHAKKFSDDRLRDLYGLSEAVQRTFEMASGVKSTEMDSALENLTHFAESGGIQTLGDDFKRVSDAARELGRLPQFHVANKLLSKFAHPTAWAVHTAGLPGPEAEYFGMILQDGVVLALNAILTIRRVIRTQYSE